MERKGGGARPRKSTGAAAGGGVFRRGAGRGTGPVGQSDGYAGRRASRGSGGATPPGGFYPPGGTGGTGSGFSSGARAAGAPYIRRLLPLLILLIAGYFIIKSCGLIGGPAEELLPTTVRTDVSSTTARWTTAPTITGNPANNDIDASTGITGPRTPRTVIRGNGQDTVTLMVYMCGTDLESESGMATADLNEMLYADVGDHVNIIVETGGTTRWRNSVIRSDTNQRYRVTDTGLEPLEEDLGRRVMTDPDTLRDFVSYCAERYPANRYALIFWDHGGGTLGGYGYDQVFPGEGAMSIGEIDGALESAGVTFDFVGFDACLMATLETAYMMNYHADYLIASEETEPGIGWYYTDWITALSADPSMPTS
nr:peptidase C11 [Clostridia bacterium]